MITEYVFTGSVNFYLMFQPYHGLVITLPSPNSSFHPVARLFYNSGNQSQSIGNYAKPDNRKSSKSNKKRLKYRLRSYLPCVFSAERSYIARKALIIYNKFYLIYFIMKVHVYFFLYQINGMYKFYKIY